ncbi:MAG TPA: hypothetical protein VHM19_02745, partial [Polyangiales bacterium]|nr:hypothetical protein [Polyangiales bacterium]
MTATLTVRARLEGALFAFAQSEPLGVRLALLAMLLSLPGAFMGFQLDDHVGRYVFSELPGAKHLYQLYGGGYALANGDAGDNHWQVESGYAPWWTYPQLRISFLRPLSLLTHELDAQLFPDSSLLQHAHSLLWLGLLVVIATWLYRGVLGAFVGGLAALLFALDHTRGFAVGFVMNRHALIGAALGALCLALHQRERRGPAAIVYAAALLSSESAIAVAGYLFAYAVFLQPGKARRRLVSLVPYVAITLLWRALYNATGHGGFGSGLYVDPAREPIEFAVTLLRRAPIQALGQLLVPPAEVYWLYGPRLAQAVWCAGVLALVAFAAALVPLWQREPSARFWALGCALSLVPASAGYPSGRQMAFVGLGAMPLLAQLWHLHAVTLRDAPRAEGGR